MPSYEVTAEFYDLLHAAKYLHRTRDLIDRWLGRPHVGVIDVGAGTGLGTVLLARRCAVTVHAIEPARSMRAVLISRLAGAPDLLPRVRVHAQPVQQLGLCSAADFALCLNTMGTLDAAERASVLRALAVAITPGGRLLVERPPARSDTTSRRLTSGVLGGELYSGDVTCVRVDGDRVRWRFAYRVTSGDTVVREEQESFDGYLTDPEGFDREIERAGLKVTERDGDEIVLATPEPATHAARR